MKITDTKGRIKELLELYNLNQSEFCERTKITKSALSNYLNGSRVPRQEQVFKIADAFNISPSWLLGYDVPMQDGHIPGPESLPSGMAALEYIMSLSSPNTDNDMGAPSPPKEPNIVSDKEYVLVEAYRRLDYDQQEMIQRMIHSFIHTPKPPFKGQTSLFDFGDDSSK